MRILFVYDDRQPVPSAIRQVIGIERFGDVVRRKERLADTIAELVGSVRGIDFLRIADEAALTEFRPQLEREPPGTAVFRLPSALLPLDLELFQRTIQKLPYALDPMLYGERQLEDAPALLFRDDALALFGLGGTGDLRSFFNDFEQRALAIGNLCRFVDLRDLRAFLSFMAGATETRHFNSARIEGDVFRKTSPNIAKMRGEYRYFHIVDEPMKRFLLPTFDYVEQDGQASYAMEHLPVPDAALQAVHHAFDEASFAKLLDSFFAFIAARTTQAVGAAAARRQAETDIVAKLARRIDELLENETGRALDALMRTAGRHGDLRAMTERCLRRLGAELDRVAVDTVALGHGDPCLSNILFARDIGLFRLIDPRGAETRDEAWMHPIYDVAKLAHSVLGDYDFVNSGQFDVTLDGAMRLALACEGGGGPAWMKGQFRERLAATGQDYRLVRAVEASLFLSMLPLHLDQPRKLPAFCLIAGAILDELEKRRDRQE